MNHVEGGIVRYAGRPVRISPDGGKEEIVITRHGKPAGMLIGFGSKEDWFDYRLENALYDSLNGLNQHGTV